MRQKFEGVHPDLDAGKLEKILWNWALETCQRDNIPLFWEESRFRYRYTTKALGMAFNLKNPKNPGLLQRVLEKKVTMHKLMRLSPEHMWPEYWEPIFEKVAEKQLRKQLTTDIDSVPEGMLQCGKCKSKKTMYTMLQTRSSDEGENQTGITLNSTVNLSPNLILHLSGLPCRFNKLFCVSGVWQAVENKLKCNTRILCMYCIYMREISIFTDTCGRRGLHFFSLRAKTRKILFFGN